MYDTRKHFDVGIFCTIVRPDMARPLKLVDITGWFQVRADRARAGQVSQS